MNPPRRTRPTPPALTKGLRGLAVCWLALGLAAPGCHQRRQKDPGPQAVDIRDPLRDERVLFDLLANRPAALVYEQDALVIDGAAPDILKFIDGGWKASLITGERDPGDHRVALADGVSAVLRFPGRGAAQQPADRDEISLYLKPAPDVQRQAVTVLLNERSVANLELSPGYRRYRVHLQQGRLLPGENTLRLHFRAAGTIAGHRSAAAIDRVTIGPQRESPAAAGGPKLPDQQEWKEGAEQRFTAPGRVRSYGIGADARQALTASTQTRWSYYLVLPGGEGAASGPAAPGIPELSQSEDGQQRILFPPLRTRPPEVRHGHGHHKRVEARLSGLQKEQRRPVESAERPSPQAAHDVAEPRQVDGAAGRRIRESREAREPRDPAPQAAPAPQAGRQQGPEQPRVSLAFSYGVQAGGAPQDFAVVAARDGAPEQVLWTGKGEPGRWLDAEVDLSRVSGAGGDLGAALRLDLTVSGAGAIAWPRLVGEQPAPLDRAGLPPRAEHLLVVVVDALRADRMPDGPSGRLPGLAGLAARGVRLSATSQGNYALPAHASVLTGTYPVNHHLGRDTGELPPALPLLPEALQRAGFATGLFAASGYVSDRWGLNRGFDAYRNLVREGLPSASPEVWKLALPWLETQVRAGRRVFLYLDLSDPHAPYNPAQQFLPKPYGGPLRSERTAEQLLQVKRGQLKLGPQDHAYLAALYDGEVAQMDATLQQVLAALSRLQILDRTAVLLTAAHGEELFDHGSVGHGHSLYQELVSVPFLLSFPQRLASGKTLPLEAELVDVAPTLLHLAGAAVPEEMQGESLLRLCAAGAGERPRMPRAALSQHDQQLRSVRLGRYKLISAGGDHVQLYDLRTDPHELRDVAALDPIAMRAMRNVLALSYGFQRRWKKQRLGNPADLLPEFSEDLGP